MDKKSSGKDIRKEVKRIISVLKKQAVPENREGMARYGIEVKYALGVSIPFLRKIAKETGRNHELALKLWDTKIHEARILAGYIDDPGAVTEGQLEFWVRDFNSWDLCDQVCHLFEESRFARKKCVEWSSRKEEFVKRTAFSLMAAMAVHDKKSDDKEFVKFFPLIKRAAVDERNYVRKAVNWALRNIGKRNPGLNKAAIKLAEEIKILDSKTAKWIASDALRELKSSTVQERIKRAAG